MHLAPERSVPILLYHNNVPGDIRRDILRSADNTSLLAPVEAAPAEAEGVPSFCYPAVCYCYHTWNQSLPSHRWR